MGVAVAAGPREARAQVSVVEGLVGAPYEAARLAAWYAEVEDAVLDLSGLLPQGPEDYDARKLFEYLIVLRRAMATDPDGELGEVELAVAQMRDVIGRISRRLEHEQIDDPHEAAQFVFAAMQGVPARELGRLLGVSEKTIGAWRAGGAVERGADRVVLVAQLLTTLRASMTPRGLMHWFQAPRPQLQSRTPLELLATPASARAPLTALARGARAQLGS